MKVSVIIPYNQDRGYLDLCIDSIKAQTYPDVEIIPSFSPGTCGYNFNRGLEKATGEFIKLIAEDDWLPPTSLADSVNGIGGAPWICANAWNMGKTTIELDKSVGLSFKETLDANGIHGGSTLFRTEILREIGGMDEALEVGEEWDMYLRLMSRGYMPGYIDKEVYYYRRWNHGKSWIDNNYRHKWRQTQLNLIRARYDFDSDSQL